MSRLPSWTVSPRLVAALDLIFHHTQKTSKHKLFYTLCGAVIPSPGAQFFVCLSTFTTLHLEEYNYALKDWSNDGSTWDADEEVGFHKKSDKSLTVNTISDNAQRGITSLIRAWRERDAWQAKYFSRSEYCTRHRRDLILTFIHSAPSNNLCSLTCSESI